MPEMMQAFGTFELRAAQRLLLEQGKPVRLGSRALDILIALTRRAGDVLSKEELIQQVWPGIHVEETNLRVHIAALRKALRDGRAGNRFIANIPGRGYAFMGAVQAQPHGGRQVAEDGPGPLRNAPMGPPRLIGRASIVTELSDRLPRCRFMTLIGPGGVGKTAVAIAVAEVLASSLRHGVTFVDLAPVSALAMLAGAVATALGLEPVVDGLANRVAAMLRDGGMLLVLDNCEHLAGEVAALAVSLLGATPNLLILATSREPLRADGEWVYGLPPLDLPTGNLPLTAVEALQFPAVELFAERASSALGGYDLSDRDVPVVTDICRRLDGIALAIEFAAGRLDAFSLGELSALLKDRFHILTRGRRAALPRHQTLRATLDWSYEALGEVEQVTLRRLAIFNGAFSFNAARAIADDPSCGGGESLAELFEKSLVTADVSGQEPLYRLLETTRVYAREKLEESGEASVIARRHAAWICRFLEEETSRRDAEPTGTWQAALGNAIDDLRAALLWAFGPEGDAALGVRLTLAALPLWFDQSLVDEGLGWSDRALAALDPASTNPAIRRSRMRLLAAAPGWLRMYTRRRLDGVTAGWETALQLALELGDLDHQMRAVWSLWGYRIEHGEFGEALRLAERFCRLATSAPDAADGFVGERMAAASQHFLGDQLAARARLDSMLTRYVPPRRHSHNVRFQFDQRVGALITRSRVLWVQGHPERALTDVATAVELARAAGNTLMLGSTLVQAACPVCLLAGELSLAEQYSSALADSMAERPIESWRALAQGFAGEITARRGQVQEGLAHLTAAVDALRAARFTQFITSFLAALARTQIQAGKPEQALAAIDEALAFCDRGGERWALSELKRIRGEALLRAADDAASTLAENDFRDALRIASAQGALAWELRAATSLAAMKRGENDAADSAARLADVIARFDEGFALEDLAAARALLASLGDRDRM